MSSIVARLRDRRALPLALALVGAAALTVWVASDDDAQTDVALAQPVAAVVDAGPLPAPIALASGPQNGVRKPGKCPGPRVLLVRGHFQDSRTDGHMLEFTVQVQRDGDTLLKDIRGETKFEGQARERLALLDRAQMRELGGSALPSDGGLAALSALRSLARDCRG